MNSCCTLLWLHQLYGSLVGLNTEATIACYNSIVIWSCSIFNITQNTHSKPTVRTYTVSKGLHYIFMSNHTITFSAYTIAVMRCCCSCGPVRRSFHWKAFSVVSVMLVAFTSALSTNLSNLSSRKNWKSSQQQWCQLIPVIDAQLPTKGHCRRSTVAELLVWYIAQYTVHKYTHTQVVSKTMKQCVSTMQHQNLAIRYM